MANYLTVLATAAAAIVTHVYIFPIPKISTIKVLVSYVTANAALFAYFGRPLKSDRSYENFTTVHITSQCIQHTLKVYDLRKKKL